jgi:hypothetical protein
MTVDTARLPTLKLGSTGKAVTAAKMGVNHWNEKSGNTTPFYGVFFAPLVKQFKKAMRIEDTSSVIGPATWKKLLPHIPAAGKKLLPQVPVVPALGPVVKGGQSVLAHDCTHATDGVPLYPAFDDAFAQGVSIIAPEALTVTRQSTSRPGQAFYATGKSGIRWWFGHLEASPAVGKVFAKGTIVGRTCVNTIGGGPHVHVGVNVEALWGKGKELAHHKNYTHGAPTIGAQLSAHSLT